ncbi:MAG: 1-(5-phosphoribosyl)-5-[(5-phosphoribosylamino)methylideneamino]imidazole-4-carboxamide isomerase [Clostridiales bacterium]|nr:1-(5-phosphoribosyl)-5-[(5-phosphoribosylamino)methylideneamino]imidazole-4-carboxamide isomerase [Clostridiales bacterium]
MKIYPAIDLRGGQVVRLTQGDYNQMTVYGDDPVKVAEGFAQAGSTRLHAVDLDGAKDGSPMNREVIRELCKQPLFIEVGGGMRTEQNIIDTLALGVDRVILGTIAVTNFELVKTVAKKYGSKIAVGVDAKDGYIATHGWKEVSDVSGVEFCKTLRDIGISTVIYTDISKDGGLSGTNLAVYEELSTIDGLDIIASGGVTFESEIAALRDMNIHGCILGKALYAGKLDLARCIAIARGEAEPC